jgi:hypothetical protein
VSAGAANEPKIRPTGEFLARSPPLRRVATAYAVARTKQSACGALWPLARPKTLKKSIFELF